MRAELPRPAALRAVPRVALRCRVPDTPRAERDEADETRGRPLDRRDVEARPYEACDLEVLYSGARFTEAGRVHEAERPCAVDA